MASHPLEVTDGVTDGIHSHVAHVQSPRWVWKHGQDIKLLPAGTLRKTTDGQNNVQSFEMTSWDL